MNRILVVIFLGLMLIIGVELGLILVKQPAKTVTTSYVIPSPPAAPTPVHPDIYQQHNNGILKDMTWTEDIEGQIGSINKTPGQLHNVPGFPGITPTYVLSTNLHSGSHNLVLYFDQNELQNTTFTNIKSFDDLKAGDNVRVIIIGGIQQPFPQKATITKL